MNYPMFLPCFRGVIFANLYVFSYKKWTLTLMSSIVLIYCFGFWLFSAMKVSVHLSETDRLQCLVRTLFKVTGPLS